MEKGAISGKSTKLTTLQNAHAGICCSYYFVQQLALIACVHHDPCVRALSRYRSGGVPSNLNQKCNMTSYAICAFMRLRSFANVSLKDYALIALLRSKLKRFKSCELRVYCVFLRFFSSLKRLRVVRLLRVPKIFFLLYALFSFGRILVMGVRVARLLRFANNIRR